MFYQLDHQNSLTVHTEKYGQWPNFIAEVSILNGLHNPQYLPHILKADNLFCAAWRAPIPAQIQRHLARHQTYHTELLELAQLDPMRFLEIDETNPALALAIAAYWAFDGSGGLPARHERDQFRRLLFRLKRRQILGELGYPAGNEIVRILEKIPVGIACVFQVRNILDLCRTRANTRLLRHLPEINLEVGSLLSGCPVLRDMGLLHLAATTGLKSQVMVSQLARSIIDNRERALREPAWPYQGKIKTLEQLIRAERFSAWLAGNPPEQLPAPPVDPTLAPAPLKLEALTLRSAVSEEAREMGHCLVEHLRDICGRRSYAYRLMGPERGTVLLQRQGSHWLLSEAALQRNHAPISESTLCLLEQWLERTQA